MLICGYQILTNETERYPSLFEFRSQKHGHPYREEKTHLDGEESQPARRKLQEIRQRIRIENVVSVA